MFVTEYTICLLPIKLGSLTVYPDMVGLHNLNWYDPGVLWCIYFIHINCYVEKLLTLSRKLRIEESKVT